MFCSSSPCIVVHRGDPDSIDSLFFVYLFLCLLFSSFLFFWFRIVIGPFMGFSFFLLQYLFPLYFSSYCYLMVLLWVFVSFSLSFLFISLLPFIEKWMDLLWVFSRMSFNGKVFLHRIDWLVMHVCTIPTIPLHYKKNPILIRDVNINFIPFLTFMVSFFWLFC